MVRPPRLDERGLPVGYRLKDGLEISPRDFVERWRRDRSRVMMLDVRLAPEVDIAGFPGAAHVPLQELGDRLDELELEGFELIGTMCHHGARSMTAAALLHQMGFPGARSIAGGAELWSWAVDPSLARYSREGARVWLEPPATTRS